MPIKIKIGISGVFKSLKLKLFPYFPLRISSLSLNQHIPTADSSINENATK